MKILLIEVKSTSEYIHNGLAYLAGSLSSDFQVRIFDLNIVKWSDKKLIEEVLNFRPDIIGFSMKSSNLTKAKELADLLKQQFKTVFVVGGPHITLVGTDFFKNYNQDLFDYGFIGEAESSFADFCNKLNQSQGVKDVAGLIYKDNNQWLVNPIEYNQELDKINFPSYSSFEGLDWSTIGYPLLTSRGCPYQCIYCSVSKVSGSKWRYRSSKSVVRELKIAKKKYKIKNFVILDDNFTLDKKRAIDICDLIIEENIELPWGCPNGLRADSLNKELVNKMKQAGCNNVSIGIESGDPKVFEFINKGETLDDIKNAVDLLKAEQINTVGFLIIGLPYDSIKATKKSLKFVESLNLSSRVKWNMLVPYPKTFLWDWVKKNGRFLIDFTSTQHFNRDGLVVDPVFETDNFSSNQRKKAFVLANISTGMYHIVIKKTKIKFFYKLKIIFYLLKYNPRILLQKIINKIKLNFYRFNRSVN